MNRILLFVLFFNLTIFSQSQIQSLMRQGMHQALNMDQRAAEKTFNKVIKLKPDQPYGYYGITKIHFWNYLGSKDQTEYNLFIKFADLTQEKIDKSLDLNSKDYLIQYIGGNLASFKAMTQSAENSSVNAFFWSKKAVGYYEESLAINPKFYDSYLGLGLFDYAMGFVPDFLKWAVNLTGLSSNKARGFRYIKTAFKKGTIDNAEAAFHLSKIYTDYLAEYDSAFILLKSLIEKYPHNPLFSYQYAVSLIKDKQLDKANEVLNKVIKLNNKNFSQVTALAFYRKGEIYYKKNQFNLAVSQYKKYLDSSKELDLKGIAALNCAISYKVSEDNEQVKKYLLLAKNGNQDIFEDSYAKKKSDLFLSNGIPPLDLKLIIIKNNLDAGKFKIVYDSLKSNIQYMDREHKPIAYIYFSEAALNLEKYDEAVYAADQSVILKSSMNKWSYPMALILKAKAKYYSKMSKEAFDILTEAEISNNFEFKDYIQTQIEWLKRRLQK